MMHLAQLVSPSVALPAELVHVYFVPTAVCTRVLYTLILTEQLSFLSDRSEHRIHPGDTTHTHRLHTHTHHTESDVELGFPD